MNEPATHDRDRFRFFRLLLLGLTLAAPLAAHADCGPLPPEGTPTFTMLLPDGEGSALLWREACLPETPTPQLRVRLLPFADRAVNNHCIAFFAGNGGGHGYGIGPLVLSDSGRSSLSPQCSGTTGTFFLTPVLGAAAVAYPEYRITLYARHGDGLPSTLTLPAADEAATLPPVSGRLSGSYYDRSRAGEGIYLDIATVGARNVLSVAWFTYDDSGHQRWYYGSSDFVAGARNVAAPIFLTRGARFGAAFNPADVVLTAAGTVSLQWTDCRHVRFDWSLPPQSGSFVYERLDAALAELSCQ